MITGIVKSNEARIKLKVKGDEAEDREIEAVIDTGYTGFLTLPLSLIQEFGLTWQSVGRGILADGSECLFDVYDAILVWDGADRQILVDEADTDPLIGMTLLNGFELKMQVRPGGKVTIKPLKSGPTRGTG